MEGPTYTILMYFLKIFFEFNFITVQVGTNHYSKTAISKLTIDGSLMLLDVFVAYLLLDKCLSFIAHLTLCII